VANGIVVVETSGNGSQNLDDPVYATGNDGHWPFLLENDSGAIIVTGAQSPHAATPRSHHAWSNYGATIDLQGWGDSIVTTGYGDLYSAEGPDRDYRSSFGGSSGASPMVVGAIAILQEAHKAAYGSPLPPSTVKHLLVSTGTRRPGPGTWVLYPTCRAR
jgi:subtilisin family serine protease